MTRVIVAYVLRMTGPLLGAAVLIAWFFVDRATSTGILVGGALGTVSGLGLIVLVGKLLDSGGSTGKPGLFLLLGGKLLGTALLLWLALSVAQASGLGLLLGIALSLAGLVVGAHLASNSEAGRAAIREAEERIAEEMKEGKLL